MVGRLGGGPDSAPKCQQARHRSTGENGGGLKARGWRGGCVRRWAVPVDGVIRTVGYGVPYHAFWLTSAACRCPVVSTLVKITSSAIERVHPNDGVEVQPPICAAVGR